MAINFNEIQLRFTQGQVKAARRHLGQIKLSDVAVHQVTDLHDVLETFREAEVEFRVQGDSK